MKRKKFDRWVIGGIVFLLVLLYPLSAFCQKAAIKDVNVKGMNGTWKVSFNAEN
jgi:hypothetical protein